MLKVRSCLIDGEAVARDDDGLPIELKPQLEARTRELAEAREALAEALEQHTADK